MPDPPDPPREPRDRPDRLAWAAFTLIVVPALVRASVTHEPFPRWSADPFARVEPVTWLGPTLVLGLDLAGILGAAIAVTSRRWAGDARDATAPLLAVLIGVGAVPVFLHGRAELAHLLVGSGWIATLAGAVGLAQLCRSPRLRRLALATLLGFAGVLVAKGVVQVAVEHPLTVRAFEADRAGFLAANGWDVDSASARLFERRLRQPEATGWFGLANVYATFASAALVGFVTLAWAAWRRPGDDPAARSWRLGLLAGVAIAGAGLWMSGSKGGLGAAGVGAVGVAGAVLGLRIADARRRRLALTLLLPAMAGLGLLAVLMRGAVGDRIGELSLLFRWFYVQGAARVFWEHPAIGVGPAGFKEAYLSAKPPASPEEVVSPHSILFDWLATLGAGAGAWIAAAAVLLGRVGRAVQQSGSERPQADAPDTLRTDRAVLCLVALLVVGASAVAEWAMATPEGSIARLLGIVAWLGLGMSILRGVGGPGLALAGAGVAGVLAAHVQIEVSAVWSSSGPLVGCLLGVAAGGARGPRVRRLSARSEAAIAGGVFGALALALALLAGPRVARWERALGAAATLPQRAAALVRDLQDPAGRPGAAVLAELAALTGIAPADTPDALEAQLASLFSQARRDAARHLTRAGAHRPRHAPTRSAITSTLMGEALARHDAGDPDWRTWARRAVEAAEAFPRADARSTDWNWLGTTHLAVAEREPPGSIEARAALERAGDAYRRLVELDPYGLNGPTRLVEITQALGLDDEARTWAARALERDDLLALDPLKGLSAAQRGELEALVARP